MWPGRLRIWPCRLRIWPSRLRIWPGRLRIWPGRLRIWPGWLTIWPGRSTIWPGFPGQIVYLKGQQSGQGGLRYLISILQGVWALVNYFFRIFFKSEQSFFFLKWATGASHHFLSSRSDAKCKKRSFRYVEFPTQPL